MIGRSKKEMNLIEDESHKNVTFSKRRAALLKKAHEVSALCDVEIGLIIFSSTGELFEYSTHQQSMEQIIERYQFAKGTQTSQRGEVLNMSEKLRTESQLLDLSLNSLRCSSELNSRKYEDLQELELQLECSINKVRARKEQLLRQQMDNLARKVENMEGENNQLCHWVNQIEEQQATSRQQQVTIDAKVLEQKQQELLNQFPFHGEEQPVNVLQLVSPPPNRPYLVQPMQSHLGEASFHHQDFWYYYIYSP